MEEMGTWKGKKVFREEPHGQTLINPQMQTSKANITKQKTKKILILKLIFYFVLFLVLDLG